MPFNLVRALILGQACAAQAFSLLSNEGVPRMLRAQPVARALFHYLRRYYIGLSYPCPAEKRLRKGFERIQDSLNRGDPVVQPRGEMRSQGAPNGALGTTPAGTLRGVVP